MLSSSQRQEQVNSSCCALGQRRISAPGNTGSSDPSSGCGPQSEEADNTSLWGQAQGVWKENMPTSCESDLHIPDTQGLPWTSQAALRSWRVGCGGGGVVVGEEAAQRQVKTAQGRRGAGKTASRSEPGGA